MLSCNNILFLRENEIGNRFLCPSLSRKDISSELLDRSLGESDCPITGFLIEISDDFSLEKWGFLPEINCREAFLFSEKCSYFPIDIVLEFLCIGYEIFKRRSVFWVDPLKFGKDIDPEVITQILCIRITRILTICYMVIMSIFEDFFFRDGEKWTKECSPERK